MDDSPGYATWKITPDLVGGRIEVSGTPVVGATDVRLEFGANQPTTVTVRQIAHSHPIEGAGIVRVEVPTDTSPAAREAVLLWLDSLDPETVEQSALDRQGWDSGGLAKEILDVLRELAQAAL